MRPAEKFVLKPFRVDDEPEAESMVKRGADALENILVRGLDHTMNHFNS
jgi:peptidyl-tRNA hydrolase